jgi:predicted helicase
VLDPSWAPAAIPVPTTLFESRWEHRIVDAVWLLLGDHPIPLTFFGDYHQLCVANPLGVDCSRRYERGIHYTPTPIVDYLVNNILGRALAGRSINDASRLRILDPSCGCGAFLIAVLRYLLRWFEDCASKTEATNLANVQDRFDMLGRMILGVDIDERATAWTARLLSLATWEASIAQSHEVRQPTVLAVPDFRKSIVCQSFLEAEPKSPLGQVDVIIGGPPFVRLRELHRSQRTQIREYRRRFQTARRGQFDLYMLFIERALEFLADGGYLGFSVANTFIRTIGGDRVRRLIARRSRVIEILEFEDKEVYPEAVTQIALLSLAKGIPLTRSRHVLTGLLQTVK